MFVLLLQLVVRRRIVQLHVFMKTRFLADYSIKRPQPEILSLSLSLFELSQTYNEFLSHTCVYISLFAVSKTANTCTYLMLRLRRYGN